MSREEARAQGRYDAPPSNQLNSPKKIPNPVRVAMAEAPKNPEGQAMDRKRICPVEPVLG